MELRYDSSKEAKPIVTDTFVPPVLTPPPTGTWPRVAPNILDISFVDQDSILKAKYLDGSPGYDGNGGAIHYGSISGPVDSWQPFLIPGKLSNPTSPPQWLVDPVNGLPFLRTSTAGCVKEPQPQVGCFTCRLLLFNVLNITPRKRLFLRWMDRFAKKTWDGQTDLGIKLSGVMGEELQLGRKVSGGWNFQWYRYDAEGSQIVTPIPGIVPTWDRWYTFEMMIEANTMTNGAHNADGTIACKVDGQPLFSRTDVTLGATVLNGAMKQLYHGGQLCPGPLEIDTAAFALSYADWIGPAPGIS